MKNTISKVYVVVFLIIFIFHFTDLYAQTGDGQTTTSEVALPTFIPPSGTAASLGKFGDIPVGLYTGVPNISIPLYEIKVGNSFSLPISLSYHSTGMKVEETAGWMGLGWAFNAGGVITRSMHGKADDGSNGYWIQSAKSDLDLAGSSPYYSSSFWVGGFDTEPDIYYFNFGGRSGKFILDTTVAHLGHCMPYENLKIVPGGGLGAFTITDEYGIIYVFNAAEVTTLETYSYNSAWFLSKVITPAGVITFTYNTSTPDNSSNTQTSYLDFILPQGSSYASKSAGTSTSSVEVSSPVLTRIQAPDQSIELYSSKSRTDQPGTSVLDSMAVKDLKGTVIKKFTFSHSYFGNTNSSRYQDIRLKLDTVFERSISDRTQKVYGLSYNSPTDVPSTDSKAQDYWGYYNGKANSTLLPAMSQQQYSFLAADVPGADRSPNAAYAQIGTLQSITYPTGGATNLVYESNSYGYIQGSPIADTQYVSTSVQAAAAKSTGINIPSQTTAFTLGTAQNVQVNYTGSYTGPVPQGDGPSVTLNKVNADGSRTALSQYTVLNSTFIHYIYMYAGNYELIASVDGNNQQARIWANYSQKLYNSPADLITTYQGGGLRIQKVISTDSIGGPALIKQYKYTDANDSTRSSGNLITPVKFIEQYYTYWARSSTSALYMGNTQGSPIGYNRVVEFVSANNTTPVGKKISYFNTYPNNSNGNTFTLQNAVTPYYSGGGFGGNKMAFDYDVYRGYLLKEDIYNASGVLIRESIHNYNLDSSFNAGSRNYFQLTSRRGTYYNQCNPPCGCNLGEGCSTTTYLVLVKNTICSPWIFKTSDINTTFDQNGLNPLKDTINYYYDTTAINRPTRITTTNSKGDSLKTINYYIVNKANISGLSTQASIAIDSMVARNMIAPAIQEEHYRNNVLITRKRTDYKVWNNPRRNIAVSNVWLQIGTGTLEDRLDFISYDTANNVVQVAKSNDINISYLWDYSAQYPVAEVKNADSNSIAYTSFEAGSAGNWSIGSGTIDSTMGITGTRSYILSGTITKAGLNSALSYIVSYWTQNTSACTITGTITGYPIKGKTINGWTLYVHKVTGQSTVTVSGSGHIDELRLYPSNAQMTTYTYKPLVGQTSQCDVDNRITRFEYDGLQRLLRIRDQDFNIIKQYDYQYQVSNRCGTNCYILPAQTSAGTNLVGYPVGVFDLHGKLLGNATGATQFVSLWNADTADSRIGTLAVGNDSLHFKLTLNTGMTLPAGVTGMRYYQVDLAWNKFDGIRNGNATYVDFGDGTGMRLPSDPTSVASPLAPNTTYSMANSAEYNTIVPYYIHTYADSTQKTVTFYHTDSIGNDHLDNYNNPAGTMIRLKNLRGNLPQNLTILGASSYQQASMNKVDSIHNWNSIRTIQYINFISGDGVNPCKNMGYTQDFMQYNPGLQKIHTTNGYYSNGYRDTTFKLSRLKSNWNTYFTGLQSLIINDDHWSREDLSALKQLNFVQVVATTQDHQDDVNSPLIPIPSATIDAILNQIAAGAGQSVSNGSIYLFTGGSARTTNSDAAVTALTAKGWTISIQ